MPPTNFRLGARGAIPTRLQLNSYMQRIVWPYTFPYVPPDPPEADDLIDWQSITFLDSDGETIKEH